MKRLLATITLISFIAIGGFGFMHAYQMMGHGHMDMSPCPFMQGHEAICNMNALEHLTAWQNTFTTIISDYSLVFSILALSLWGLLSFRVFRPPDKNLWVRYKRDWQRHIPNLYEELFSKGILNPKAP